MQDQVPNKRWDTLRRSLRICHSVIDTTLNELHSIKVAGSQDTIIGKKAYHEAGEDLEKQILSTYDMKKTIRNNISQAIRITDEMSSACIGDPIRSSQLRRLEAVTANYDKDFQHTLLTFKENIERHRLLAPSTIQQIPRNLDSSESAEQHQLLREKSSINSSMSVLDQTLAQGREAMSSLNRQKDRLHNFKSTLQQYSHRFSHLRSVMSKIQRAKLKQTAILAIVVGVCLLFILWYWVG